MPDRQQKIIETSPTRDARERRDTFEIDKRSQREFGAFEMHEPLATDPRCILVPHDAWIEEVTRDLAADVRACERLSDDERLVGLAIARSIRRQPRVLRVGDVAELLAMRPDDVDQAIRALADTANVLDLVMLGATRSTQYRWPEYETHLGIRHEGIVRHFAVYDSDAVDDAAAAEVIQ